MDTGQFVTGVQYAVPGGAEKELVKTNAINKIFVSYFCSVEKAGLAISFCNSGIVILCIMTGDFGGGG